MNRLFKFATCVLASAAAVSGVVAAGATHPAIVYVDSHCVNPSCNNGDGCAWVSGIWTYWYPHGACAEAFPAGSGGGCTMTWRLCRQDDIYAGLPGCWGSVRTIYTYEYGCSS